jgi:hypothetical protein
MVALPYPSPLGVLAAFLAMTFIGWLWFAVLFGRTYAVVLGRDHLPPSKPSGLYFVGPSICALVTATALGVLMRLVGTSTLEQAVGIGTLVGVGLLGATSVNMGINPNISRPLTYGFLSAAYFAYSCIVACVLLHVVG